MKNFIVNISRKYSALNVRFFASATAFYILVSVIPLITVAFFALYALSHDLSRELESIIADFLPQGLVNSFSLLMEGIKKRELFSLVPFSILTVLWSSTKGINGLCQGTEIIYGKSKKRSLISSALKSIKRTLFFYLFLFVLVALIFALRLFYTEFGEKWLIFDVFAKFKVPISIILLTLFFSLFYGCISHSSIRKQIQGGIFSSLGFVLFTYFYSIYISYSLTNGSIYHEAGAIVLFSLWCYFSVNIVFIGAIMNTLTQGNIYTSEPKAPIDKTNNTS